MSRQPKYIIKHTTSYKIGKSAVESYYKGTSPFCVEFTLKLCEAEKFHSEDIANKTLKLLRLNRPGEKYELLEI